MMIVPMAAVDALDSEYPFVDENPSILNEDVFKSAFSVEKVDKVLYNYTLTPLGDGRSASVAFQMKFVIDGASYTTSVVGNVNGYALPESDTLWEGPIDGEMTIKGIEFRIIIGFMQRASTGEAQISVTLQNDTYDFMVVSFGDHILNGDVLDCINQRFGSSSHSDATANVSGVQSGQLNVNDGGSASTNAFDSDKTVIMYPGIGGIGGGGGGGGNVSYDIVTDTDTWKYQSRKTNYLGSSYTASQSSVYFEKSKNVLMVTIRPYTQSVNSYYEANECDTAVTVLESLDVTLNMTDVSGDGYAYINGVDFPETTNSFSNMPLSDLFAAILKDLGVPVNTISTVFNNLTGNVSYGWTISKGNVNIKKIEVSLGDLEQITTGIPIKFQLAKGGGAYVGNTPYTVTATAVYHIMMFNSEDSLINYVSREDITTHTGTVTLQ